MKNYSSTRKWHRLSISMYKTRTVARGAELLSSAEAFEGGVAVRHVQYMLKLRCFSLRALVRFEHSGISKGPLTPSKFSGSLWDSRPARLPLAGRGGVREIPTPTTMRQIRCTWLQAVPSPCPHTQDACWPGSPRCSFLSCM